MGRNTQNLNRRTFLQSGAATAAVAMGVNASQASEKKPDTKKILNYQSGMKYRRFGETDIYLSVITMGGLVMNENSESHHYAIDQGVNHVHISTSYIGGTSIVKLGEVMKTKRDKVYISLKDNFFSSSDYEKGDYSKIDSVLKTLNTDYVDFFMFNRHDIKSASNPKIIEYFEKLKAMGKVRFAGLTSHGDVKGSMAAGIESGMYHMVNPVLNQPNLEAMDEELKAAYNKKIAVMAMKTMKGQKSREQEVAYLKKVLSNPAVTTVVKGIGSMDMFDAYLKGVNETLTSMEDRQLYRYAQANRSENCMMCDECKGACPESIEISTVLRCKDYYYEQQGDRPLAIETYHELPVNKRWSSQCGDCRICEETCPNGIKIIDRLKAAQQMFV